MSSHDMMNPYGGVNMGRVVESFDPNECHWSEKAFRESLCANVNETLPPLEFRVYD